MANSWLSLARQDETMASLLGSLDSAPNWEAMATAWYAPKIAQAEPAVALL
jgi:hypothetical protein